MKHKFFRESGQALILIALGAIGLFGIAGLAIDGSAKFSDRRHAQNAADTAALTGALAMARGDAQWDLEALNRALDNGYDDDHTSNEVQVHSPPISGAYSCSSPDNNIRFDCHDYVQVIIDSHVDTYFARVIGIMQTHNHVEAVASSISSDNYFDIGGSAVIALNPEGCALMSQGGTNVQVVGGGLYSNSASSCSFMKSSCAGTTNIDADTSGTVGTISMVGGAQLNTGCMPDANVAPGVAVQIPFPPPWKEMTPPAECSQPTINITGNPASAVLQPGHYTAMPPRSNMKDITLKPGVYCIDSNITIGSTDFIRVEGTFGVSPGVFLYLKPGGSFRFNGGSSAQLWNMTQAQVDLDPTRLTPYQKYLIYAAPDYSSGTPQTCNINGGSASAFKGAVYAPYCDVTLNGGSGPYGFQTQIIAFNVKFSGTSDIYLQYDANSTPDFYIPLQVGLNK